MNKQVLSPALVRSAFVAIVVPTLTSFINLEFISFIDLAFKKYFIPSNIESS